MWNCLDVGSGRSHASRWWTAGSAALLLACSAAWGAAPAFAAEPRPADGGSAAPPVQHLVPTDLQFRIEPPGLQLIGSWVTRYPDPPSESALFRDTYREWGVDAAVSPAFAELGAHIEVKWPAVFVVRASYAAIGFFGARGYAMRFEADDAYSEEVIARREEGNDPAGRPGSEAGLGHRLTLAPTLQAQVGQVVVRNTLTLTGHVLPVGDQYMRERNFDLLQAHQDGIVANTAQVLWEPWRGAGAARVLVGPYDEWAMSLEQGQIRHRVGGLALWIPVDRWGAFGRPRTYLQAGTHLHDRNREGVFFAQGGVGLDF